MLHIPTCKLTPAWQEVLNGYELQSMSNAPRSVVKRLNAVRIMAKHATVDGHEPEAVTKPWMTKYFLAGQGPPERRPGDVVPDPRSFWLWFAQAYEAPNPMTGIDRPKGKPALVQVPTEADIEAVLKGCARRGFQSRHWARVRATVVVSTESLVSIAPMSAPIIQPSMARDATGRI